MKIPTFILAIVCAGFAGWLSWVSLEIIGLEKSVARLEILIARNAE